jgi:hypothetical protein
MEFIIRVFALIKCPGLLDLTQNGTIVVKAPKESYHLCIFENLVDGMSDEESFRNITSEDILKEGKLNKWLLSDIDGVMKGNSFVQRRQKNVG